MNSLYLHAYNYPTNKTVSKYNPNPTMSIRLGKRSVLRKSLRYQIGNLVDKSVLFLQLLYMFLKNVKNF